MNKNVLAFLKNQQLMTVATVSPDGQPDCAVVLFTVDDDMSLYFMTRPNTRKALNIQHNNRVAVVVWKLIDMSVQIDATAELLTDKSQINHILDRLADSAIRVGEGFFPPIFRLSNTNEYNVYKLTPTTVRDLDLEKGNVREAKSPIRVEKI